MRKIFYPLLLLLTLLALVSLACSSTVPISGGQPAPPPADTSGDNEPAAVPDAGQPAADGAGPEVLDFSDPNALAAFSDTNFYIDLNYNFTGTAADGSAVTGTILMNSINVVGPPPAASIAIEGQGAAEVPRTEIVDTSGTDYAYTAEYGCISFTGDEFTNPYSDIDNLDLIGTAPRVEVGVEVNGIITDRYALASENFPPDAFEDTEYVELQSGSLYRSRSGQVIRVELQGIGVSEALSGDPNLQGQLVYRLDFRPTSELIEITPPAACNAQPGSETEQPGGVPESSFPLLDDASGVTSLNNQMLSYNTAHSVEDVVTFYKAEFAAQGYSVLSELVLAGNAIVRFNKEGVVINLAVTPLDNGQYTVVIVQE